MTLLKFIQTLIDQEKPSSGSIVIDNYRFVGATVQSTSPSVIYFEGKTISVGFLNMTQRHRGLAFESDGNSEPYWVYVGNGTDTVDLLDHPRLSVAIGSDGHVYITQVNEHNAPINVFRSNSRGTIAGGFTLHHTIGSTFTSNNGYAYPNIYLEPDNRISMLVRNTRNNVNWYSLSVLSSVGADYTNFTEKEFTNTSFATTQKRHYPHLFWNYGTCTKRFFGVWTRRDSNNTYVAHAVLSTPLGGSYSQFTNYNNTFTKDIDANGPISFTELNANYEVNGDGASSTDIGDALGINVNDIPYLLTDNGTILQKLDPAGITSYTITGVNEPQEIRQLYSDATGSKLIAFSFDDVNGTKTKRFWTCDLNFGNWELKKTFDLVGWIEAFWGLPANLDQVPASGKVMFSGGRQPGIFYWENVPITIFD